MDIARCKCNFKTCLAVYIYNMKILLTEKYQKLYLTLPFAKQYDGLAVLAWFLAYLS